MSAIASILTILAPIVLKVMEWFSFSEEQKRKVIAYIARKQQNEAGASLPADEDAAAEAKLRAQLDAEKPKP